MAETYSQLLYRQVDPAQTSAIAAHTLIALHGHQGWLDDLLPFVTRLDPDLRVVTAEAARGVYSGTRVISKTWFGGTLEKPEAASFGDSLAQIERFIYDVQERNGVDSPRPWLLGYDQGAVLALTMGMIAPELVSGVMAICGTLPTFTNPGLLEGISSDLPVLLIHDEKHRSFQESHAARTGDQLAQLGHQVTTRWVDDASELGAPVRNELSSWLATNRR